jgi:hypothetical protein
MWGWSSQDSSTGPEAHRRISKSQLQEKEEAEEEKEED